MLNSDINIKFQIHKVSDNVYKYKLLYISKKLVDRLDGKVIHIDFKTKKIFKSSSWKVAYINSDRLSIYFHIAQSVSVEKLRDNAYLGFNFLIKEYEINTDIKDFDKILIKGLKIISDTFNKENETSKV